MYLEGHFVLQVIYRDTKQLFAEIICTCNDTRIDCSAYFEESYIERYFFVIFYTRNKYILIKLFKVEILIIYFTKYYNIFK